MLDTLQQWQQDALNDNNLLAGTFIEQVANAYRDNFSHPLAIGIHYMRTEVEKVSDCENYQDFFKRCYDPHHPIHNLSQIALWD